MPANLRHMMMPSACSPSSGLVPDRIRTMYASGNAAEAANIALSLRLDYVYVDEVERRAYPNRIRFDGSQAFEKVFDGGPVAVYGCANSRLVFRPTK